ncbi:MAG: low molecular weight phosphatase family protein, partial [Mycobacterium sp.]
LEHMGADASDFAARQLKPKIATDADLIITMTREHRETVLETAPRQLSRTFTLIEAARLTSEFGARTISDLAALRPRLAANEPSDIPDPIGKSPEVFTAVGSQIADLLPQILEVCRRSVRA